MHCLSLVDMRGTTLLCPLTAPHSSLPSLPLFPPRSHPHVFMLTTHIPLVHGNQRWPGPSSCTRCAVLPHAPQEGRELP